MRKLSDPSYFYFFYETLLIEFPLLYVLLRNLLESVLLLVYSEKSKWREKRSLGFFLDPEALTSNEIQDQCAIKCESCEVVKLLSRN